MTCTTRRTERLCGLAPVVLLCISCASTAVHDDQLPFTLKEVGPRVWAAISNPKSRMPTGANTGFVIGDDAVTVIDTSVGVDANGNFISQATGPLIAAIRKLTPLPVRFVVNTHHHVDHVGANGVFVETGATAIGQRRVRELIHGGNLRMFGEAIGPGQKAFIDALVPPTVTFEQGMELYLGRRALRLLAFPGHSGSDSVVVIPDAKVVFAGDLFWRNMLPNLADASTASWIETLHSFSQLEAGTTFVAGHGDVGDVRDVVALSDYLKALRQLVSEAQAAGKTGEQLADSIVPALRERYGQWEGFGDMAKSNISAAAAELRGEKAAADMPSKR